MPLSSKQRAHNNSVFARKFSNSSFSDKQALDILTRLADEVNGWMMRHEYEWENRTYNLADSTGCAIYKDGVLVAFSHPSSKASAPRIIQYKGQQITVNGRVLLEQAINNSKIASLGKYTLGVYSAAPYGLWVDQSLGAGGNNKIGKGWFSGSNGLKQFALDKFNEICSELMK